jgi:hypothetical protein
MRRDFDLPEGDREFLDSRGRPWEAVRSADGQRWLLIEAFQVPPGFKCDKVTIALSIEPTYPDTQIDMAYFHPSIELASGRAITALSSQAIDGKSFQRWSRHRTEQNRWRPDVDCVATHLLQVVTWLQRETEKT